MGRSTRPLKQTHPYQLSDNFRYGKYYYESFKGGQQPFWFQTVAGLPVAPTTTTIAQGVTVHGLSPSGMYWEFFASTDQDLLPVGSAGNGLNIACDLVDNEALELVPGGNSLNSRLAFVVGTDSDFFFRAKYLITDVAGSDQAVLCGFRRVETFAVPVNLIGGDGVYEDFFGLGFADATGTDIFTVNALDNDATTNVQDSGFNATNAQVIDLQVRIVGRKALAMINGTLLGNPVTKDGDGTAISSQATTTGPVFSFNSGDTLVPWIFLRHDTGIANATYLQEVEIGHLVDVGLDPNQE